MFEKKLSFLCCLQVIATIKRDQGKKKNQYSPCDRRSADSLRFVCDPQEQNKGVC